MLHAASTADLIAQILTASASYISSVVTSTQLLFVSSISTLTPVFISPAVCLEINSAITASAFKPAVSARTRGIISKASANARIAYYSSPGSTDAIFLSCSDS